MSLTPDQNTLLDNLIETALEIEHGTRRPFKTLRALKGLKSSAIVATIQRITRRRCEKLRKQYAG